MLGILVLVVIFVMGFMGLGVYSLMNPTRTARDRVSELTGGPKKSGTQSDELQNRIAQRLSELAQSQDIDDADFLRKQLLQAGYKKKNAADIFSLTRIAMAISLPVVSALFFTYESNVNMAGAVIFLAAGGYYLPQIVLGSLVDARKAEILSPFPDALDLLVTCVEAGLGLDAAIKRVADEMEDASPLLSLEFQLVGHEIAAGVPRMDALKHLGDRTGVEEIISLVNMLVQADRFGTSIADSLRVHSEIVRQKRMSRAEAEAAAVSPKLTVVMIVFLMPTLAGVLLGPAAVTVKNLMTGG